MKSFHNISKILVAVLLFGLPITICAQVAAADSSSPLRWDYSESELLRSSDLKQFTINFKVNPTDELKSQEVLAIHSYFVSEDGQQRVALDPIYVSGTRRYKVIKRRQALNNLRADEQALSGVQLYKDLDPSQLSITRTIPFERWMSKGKLVVEEKVYGCAECDVAQGSDVIARTSIPLFGEAYYAFDFIEPEKVEVKSYEEAFDCKVTFEVGRHTIKSSFGDNQRELSKLDSFIDKALKLKGATLRELQLRGYASPEGSFASNKALAERRTQALSNYVEAKYPALKKVGSRKAEGIGEDWNGLKAAVENSMLANKGDIVAIIDQYTTDTEREAAIKKLDNGKTYATLLKEYYPPLRKTVFNLHFDVRPYTEEELPEIFATNPKLLSQYEMYQLAQQHERRGENPVHIYRTIVKYFPSDVTATLNLANALLKYNKDADAALQVLEAVKDDNRALFPMAMAYDMKGNPTKVEELLKTASDKGSAHAKAFMEGEK